jgi:competence protein ComGA
MFFVEGRIMEIKRLLDQMISESFAKHAQDVYILPASEVFYIYFRYEKNEHSGRKSLRQMDSN